MCVLTRSHSVKTCYTHLCDMKLFVCLPRQEFLRGWEDYRRDAVALSSPIALALAACKTHVQDSVKKGTEPGGYRNDVEHEAGQDAEKDQQTGLHGKGKEAASPAAQH